MAWAPNPKTQTEIESHKQKQPQVLLGRNVMFNELDGWGGGGDIPTIILGPDTFLDLVSR